MDRAESVGVACVLIVGVKALREQTVDPMNHLRLSDRAGLQHFVKIDGLVLVFHSHGCYRQIPSRFYQELLGASVLLDARTAEQTGAIDLLLGDSFVTVSGGRGAPDIDHFAIGLNPWPGAERALDMVQKRFPTSEARANQNQFSKAAEVRSVMLKDPNGIGVQLGSVKYQL